MLREQSFWATFLIGVAVMAVDHKVLQLHQVRYGVELLPYDIAWNVAGGILLLAGIVLTVRAGRRSAEA